jgi:hypothetical protein
MYCVNIGGSSKEHLSSNANVLEITLIGRMHSWDLMLFGVRLRLLAIASGNSSDDNLGMRFGRIDQCHRSK